MFIFQQQNNAHHDTTGTINLQRAWNPSSWLISRDPVAKQHIPVTRQQGPLIRRTALPSVTDRQPDQVKPLLRHLPRQQLPRQRVHLLPTRRTNVFNPSLQLLQSRNSNKNQRLRINLHLTRPTSRRVSDIPVNHQIQITAGGRRRIHISHTTGALHGRQLNVPTPAISSYKPHNGNSRNTNQHPQGDAVIEVQHNVIATRDGQHVTKDTQIGSSILGTETVQTSTLNEVQPIAKHVTPTSSLVSSNGAPTTVNNGNGAISPTAITKVATTHAQFSQDAQTTDRNRKLITVAATSAPKSSIPADTTNTVLPKNDITTNKVVKSSVTSEIHQKTIIASTGAQREVMSTLAPREVTTEEPDSPDGPDTPDLPDSENKIHSD